LEREKSREKSNTTRDPEFEISLSSEDINKIEEKIKNDDTETQNNKLVNEAVLINTCTNCGIKFVPKNSMTFEILCGSCIGKKVTEMSA
jgi:hypothetical protein